MSRLSGIAVVVDVDKTVRKVHLSSSTSKMETLL
jgi:hypothetical protein